MNSIVYPSTSNHILSSLPRKEYEGFLPHLKHTEFSRGDVLYQDQEPIRYVYFLNHGIVSLVTVLQDGSEIETGMIGNEGMVGLPVILETNPKTNQRAVVLIAGDGFLMHASSLKEEFTRCPFMHSFLLRYMQAYISQISQLAVCNCAHSLDERFTCWLLACQDRIRSRELRLTHEMIAELLGVRRAGVSEAAMKLKRQGIIASGRGLIRILDRPGLEAAACECYEIVRQQFDGLLAGQRPVRLQSAAA
jgi:CRP-like cAMP-binding protein